MTRNPNIRGRFIPLLAASTMLAVSAITCSSALAAPAAGTQQETTGWIARQAPGFYRMQLGDFRITVLSDGTAPRDLPKIMSKPDEVRAEIGRAHV